MKDSIFSIILAAIILAAVWIIFNPISDTKKEIKTVPITYNQMMTVYKLGYMSGLANAEKHIFYGDMEKQYRTDSLELSIVIQKMFTNQ